MNELNVPVPLAVLFATTFAAFGGAVTLHQQLKLALEVKQARAEGVPIEDP